MSEVITTVGPRVLPEANAEKFSQIKVTRTKNGTERIYGIIELDDGEGIVERPVVLPDLAKMWGHDPNQRYSDDPEKLEMRRRINELEATVASLTQRVEELSNPGRVTGETGEPDDEVPQQTNINNHSPRGGRGMVAAASLEEEPINSVESVGDDTSEMIDVIEDDSVQESRARRIGNGVMDTLNLRRPTAYIMSRRTTGEDPIVEEVELRRERRSYMPLIIGALATVAFIYLLRRHGIDHESASSGSHGTANNLQINELQVDVDKLSTKLNGLSTNMSEQHTALMKDHDQILNILDPNGPKPGNALTDIQHQIRGTEVSAGDLSANMRLGNVYAHTPQEFVSGAFDKLSKYNLQANGVTQAKINAMVNHMTQNHWSIVSGMENAPSGGLRQHVVDTSQNWSGGHTGNYRASAAQGFRSPEELKKFLKLAQNQGITFTRVHA